MLDDVYSALVHLALYMSLDGLQKIDRREYLSSRPCMVKFLWFILALEGEERALYSSALLVAKLT